MGNKIAPRSVIKYIFSITMMLFGVTLNYLKIGNEFLGFSSVGSWLIYVGVISIAITALQMIGGKKRIIDERMEFVANKASRVTFLALVIAGFIVMILDGIRTINMPYSTFMSYLICFLLLVYFAAYKLILRKY